MQPGRRQGRRITIGLALIAALAATAVGIFFLGDILRRRQGTYTIVGAFSDATRLSDGTPVWIAGHPVGRVIKVDLRPTEAGEAAPFVATLELPIEVRQHVRRDSEVRLRTPGRLGSPVVDVMPGTLAAPILAPGETLYAPPPAKLRDLIGKISELDRSLDTLIIVGKPLEARIDARTPELERLARSVAVARDEFQVLRAWIETGPLADPPWQTALARLRSTLSQIAQAADRRASMTRDVELAPALDSLSQRAERIGERVAELERALEDRRGFVGRWEADPAIRQALEGVRAQLDSLVEATRRRPWRYIF